VGKPTLAEIRYRLQTYESTGDDLVHCLAFETHMISVKKRGAISVMVAEDCADDLAVHEHIFKPELPIRPSEKCRSILQEAGGCWSAVRISVEHIIGLVSAVLWQALDFKRQEKVGLSPVALRFRGGNVVSAMYRCPTLTPQEYLRPEAERM
jgi:hypothetical protein